MQKHLLYLLLIGVCSLQQLRAQLTYGFIENKGQWAEPYAYRAELPGAMVYLEGTSVLFDTWDAQLKSEYAHAAKFGESLAAFPPALQKHAFRQEFIGATVSTYQASKPKTEYYNYYQGPDSARWKSGVRIYEELRQPDLYPGIDLVYAFRDNRLKYDFMVQPGADAAQIRWQYRGIEKLRIRNGELLLQTALGYVREVKPYAYQLQNGEKKVVEAEFRIRNGKEVYFHFPKGYDKNLELVIDPIIIFSTYIGSLSDSWGYTATPDPTGAGYAGGIVFGSSYPTSPGAYQVTWGGGNIDAVLSKFSPNGNSLLFSTFLGGNGPDMPHSLIVTDNGELIVLGNTGSPNFPTSPGCYDNSFNGGTPLIFFGGLINYNSGADIFVTKFNASGSALIGSTFLGGTANDGLNMSTALSANYADEFRGEVIIDATGNIYITSVTQSNNFPVLNAFQPAYGGGGSDAVFARFNPTLSTLQASSYFGGSGDDAGYSIQRASNGLIYFTGGTNSANLSTTAGVVKPLYGGAIDGFLVRLNQAGTALQAATYIGTPNYNQTYFVQIDQADNVYVMGQSMGGYPIQAGPSGNVYSNAGTGQFIHKLNPALTTTLMSTCFGAGASQINLVPTAFLLHECDQLYIAGWGGQVNQSNGGIGGTVFGMPVTPGAYKTTTDGSDFYLAVFYPNAENLLYATYLGGGSSGDHVDGGTSRFNKDGVVYQAMCASCGGQDDLPTTPGAYSATNNSTNCNIALVKFDVSALTAYLDANVNAVCEGTNVVFQNLSNGGTSFTWLYGDGASSTGQNGSHTYNAPGTYTVTLIAADPQNCVPSDTAQIQVQVLPKPIAAIGPVSPICPLDSLQLQGSGGTTYSWLPAPGLNSGQATLANPWVHPPGSTTYTLIASNNCGSDTAQVQVPVINFSIQVSPDDTICIGNSKQLSASGGISYSWSPPGSLNNPSVPNPVATPSSTTLYTVTVQNPDGCILRDSTRLQVDFQPQADAGPDTLICHGDAIQLSVTGATHYLWTPAQYLNNPAVSNPVCTPDNDITYIVRGRNACGDSYDTITVHVKRIYPNSGPDTLVCPGNPVRLYSSGGVAYQWFPVAFLDSSTVQYPTAVVPYDVNFTVIITDSIGCKASDTVYVRTYGVTDVYAGPDQYIEYGEKAVLTASGPAHGSYQWIPPTDLSCNYCRVTISSPSITTTYGLLYTDTNGCYFIDSVTVFVMGNIYVPNTFTVDGNGINELFRAYGVDIEEFDMVVFNRWGEVVWKTNDFESAWDGMCGNKPCKQDTYVWRIVYTEKHGRQGELFGHVNLLR